MNTIEPIVRALAELPDHELQYLQTMASTATELSNRHETAILWGYRAAAAIDYKRYPDAEVIPFRDDFLDRLADGQAIDQEELFV